MARRHSLEILFEQEARESGLIVLPPRPIRIDEPVENSGGKRGKVVTTPDFFVINPETQEGVHVEIVNGTGHGEHKAAQRRVVDKAGVTNYALVTGYEVEAVLQAKTIEQKHSLFMCMLFWML